MLLLDYLNKHFTGNPAWSLANLESHFMLKFGVNVRCEGNVYAFKYNQLESNWDEPITQLCRGTLCRFLDGAWYIVSRPFDKFFNYQEHLNPYPAPRVFPGKSPLAMIEKADGTFIQMWFDTKQDRWRVSTQKMITPGEISQFKTITFEKLFWQTVDRQKVEQALKRVNKENTLMFELCCPENQVVTRYASPRVYLLAMRNHQTGVYRTPDTVDMVAHWMDVLRPQYLPFRFDTEEAMHAFVEAASEDHDRYGEHPEGFVVFDGTCPAFKLKNATYLRYHACITGDVKHTFNTIIATYFEGKIDDIEGVLPDMGKRYLAHLRAWWTLQMNTMTHGIHAAHAAAPFADQKAYALWVHKHAPKPYIPFFFDHQALILAGQCDAGHFEDWFMSTNKAGRPRRDIYDKDIKAACEAGIRQEEEAADAAQA